MESSRSTMIRLNNSNWVTWKPRMEDILYCKDLHEPIEEADAKPEKMSHADWKKLNRKAIGHIREWIVLEYKVPSRQNNNLCKIKSVLASVKDICFSSGKSALLLVFRTDRLHSFLLDRHIIKPPLKR
ncbi:unnamed protein product [Rhodiola kirilowii]